MFFSSNKYPASVYRRIIEINCTEKPRQIDNAEIKKIVQQKLVQFVEEEERLVEKRAKGDDPAVVSHQ